ncbi:hypothetical protein BN1221_04126c [Brenneria goodwinii]|uniref:Uncharacterized protein n=1 Tax=Brenneria goodwinii TaxID=1109412 RepID=A0A0G4K139_9GAMM|nr:hypothetical protein BN1221_04126c [Brenneria goodwinii]
MLFAVASSNKEICVNYRPSLLFKLRFAISNDRDTARNLEYYRE